MHKTTKQQGVTLMEMMIALAIIAIVMTLVVPSAQSILIQNRIVGEINELSGIVQFARHNAIEEQTNTVLCPSKNFKTCTTDWDDAKMVFSDLNNNGQRDNDEDLLVGSSLISKANNLTGPAGAVRFQANGAVNSPATLKLCHKDKVAKYARALTISLQGRVKMSRDTNNDGVYEKNDGTALSCS